MCAATTQEALIEQRAQNFTGREWVFTEIDQWLGAADEPGHRAFLLTGKPGTGKTTIAERLVNIMNGTVPSPNTPSLAEQSLAFQYFCRAGSADLDPLRFVSQLALALAKRHQEYAAVVPNIASKNIEVKQDVEQVAAGGEVKGVIIDSLTITDMAAQLAFDRLIRVPLVDLYDDGFKKPLVILIDALDEALIYDRKENMVTLLHHLLGIPQNLPPTVRFILTSRPEDRVLHQLPERLPKNDAGNNFKTNNGQFMRTLDLLNDAPAEANDVQRYVSNRLKKAEVPELEGSQGTILAQRITAAGEGNFLYAHLVLEELLPRLTAEMDVNTLPLPDRLQGIYREFLKRELANSTDEWKKSYALVMSILAVAREEGFTRVQIARMVSMEDNEIDFILDPCLQYLSYDSTSGPFRIYHQSFRDFLLEQTDETVGTYPHQAHRLIAAYFLKWDQNWHECTESYALAHLPYHLKQIVVGFERPPEKNEWQERLHKLLLDFDWLQAKLDQTDSNRLLTDFGYLDLQEPTNPLQLLFGALRLSKQALAIQKGQLSSQLHGRLLAYQQPELQALLKRARERTIQSQETLLRPITASLTRPDGPVEKSFLAHSQFGPGSGLLALAVTSQGKKLVTASSDKTLKVWDISSGDLLQRLSGHDGWVSCVVGLPGGEHLVSGSWDRTVKIWNLKTGTVAENLPFHTSPVLSLALADQGRILISGAMNGEVVLWDLADRTKIYSFQAHQDAVEAIVTLQDDHRFITGSRDKTILVWDLNAGEITKRLPGHKAGVKCLAITPGGHLISGAEDGIVRLWNIDKGTSVELSVDSAVWAVAVEREGTHFFIGTVDAEIQVWDLTFDGRPAFVRSLYGHTEPVGALIAVGSGAATRVISASTAGDVMIWAIKEQEFSHRVNKHASHVLGIAISEPLTKSVTVSSDHTVSIWNTANGQREHHISEHGEVVRCVATDSKGKYAVTASWDQTIKLWQLATGECIRSIEHSGSWINAVAFLQGDERIICATEASTLEVYDLQTGAKVDSWKALHAGGRSGIKAIAVSGNATRLATGSSDLAIGIWNLANYEKLEELSGHQDTVVSVALSHEGKSLLSAGRDNRVLLWHLSNHSRSHLLQGHENRVNAVAMMPAGRSGVTVSRDHTVRLWDLDARNVVATFFGDHEMTSCAVSEAAKVVIAGDISGHVHFLQIENA